jgi:hypothetical protein
LSHFLQEEHLPLHFLSLRPGPSDEDHLSIIERRLTGCPYKGKGTKEKQLHNSEASSSYWDLHGGYWG